MTAIRPATYSPRVVDAQIDHYLSLFGAIEIAGTKWCGKTWAAMTHAESIFYVDRGSNELIAAADPSLALRGSSPHVIDEWQLVPKLWDTVRHAVDDAPGQKGLWVLTGSATPHKDKVAHSGAGRVGRVRMLPMSLAESGDSTSSVSLRALFEGEFEGGESRRDIEELAHLCCRGGWPDAVRMQSSDAQIVVREYLQAIYDQSMPRLGKSGEVTQRIVCSIARNLGQAVTHETLRKDAFGAEDNNAETAISTDKTIASYLEAIASLYLTEPIKGWVPPKRSPKRVQTKERRYFADPSIAVSALGMSAPGLLNDWQTFGLVFENLCMRDLQVYARALPEAGLTPLRYYRDDANLEVDAIVERADGSWGAFEIKLSEDKVPQALDSLKRFKAKLANNTQANNREPAFLAVLVGAAEYAWRTEEGVYVIPIRSLCP